MGTRADRQSPHHEDTGPFHFVICQKNGFPAHGHVVFLFDIFFAVCVGKPFCAKNFQKCPGVVGNYPRPILDHVRPIWTTNHLKPNYSVEFV